MGGGQPPHPQIKAPSPESGGFLPLLPAPRAQKPECACGKKAQSKIGTLTWAHNLLFSKIAQNWYTLKRMFCSQTWLYISYNCVLIQNQCQVKVTHSAPTPSNKQIVDSVVYREYWNLTAVPPTIGSFHGLLPPAGQLRFNVSIVCFLQNWNRLRSSPKAQIVFIVNFLQKFNVPWIFSPRKLKKDISEHIWSLINNTSYSWDWKKWVHCVLVYL